MELSQEKKSCSAFAGRARRAGVSKGWIFFR